MPLRARPLGIHTLDEPVVFMRTDCHVCRSEGLSSRSRVLLQSGDRSVVATLYQVSSDLIAIDEVGLSDAAWSLLGVAHGNPVAVHHPDPLTSFGHVRSRIFGNRLSVSQFREVLDDVTARRYSSVETTAYLVSGSSFPLDEAETVALTRVMVELGETLTWPNSPIVDKHCVGGLPGNRTTPIVVAIVAALGLTMPKTSSRAITSPAGTADAMETLAPVNLDLPAIRRVIEREGGCVVWGGAVGLSPADDLLIRIERVLDLDAEGQLVASVLSKKVAAGATHLVLDIPVGPTAKLRTPAAGEALAARLASVADKFGIATRVVITDGTQPVGRGIGPPSRGGMFWQSCSRHPTSPKICMVGRALWQGLCSNCREELCPVRGCSWPSKLSRMAAPGRSSKPYARCRAVCVSRLSRPISARSWPHPMAPSLSSTTAGSPERQSSPVPPVPKRPASKCMSASATRSRQDSHSIRSTPKPWASSNMPSITSLPTRASSGLACNRQPSR